MRIALQLDPQTTHAIRRRHPGQSPAPRGGSALPINQVTRRAGAMLHPVHPEATDALLTPFYFIDVSDDADIAHLLGVLQRTPGVEAAYLEPSAAPPLPPTSPPMP